MGNSITQDKKDTPNSDDMQVSEQSIIIGFIIIIIMYMAVHCTYNYNKCNNVNEHSHEHSHVHSRQLTRPIMSGYGNIIRNSTEEYHNKRIPNMTDYDTSRLRYSVRTAEGGDLVEHLDTKCKSSYTNDEINCVQSYIARSKNGGSAVSAKYNNTGEYDRESNLLSQDNAPMSMNSGWSSSIGSGVSDSSYDIDGQSYYGSANRGLNVNANAGNDTRFNNANNSYDTDLNRGNYNSANRGLNVNANAGNDTRFNNANNSYDTDLNRGNYNSSNSGLNVNANAGNDTRFNNANNSYKSNLNINKPNQSSNTTNYSDAILQRNKINSIDKDSTTNNRMRAGSYGPNSSYSSGLNNNNSYSSNANSLSNQLNIGTG
jgi:hypothetical protein